MKAVMRTKYGPPDVITVGEQEKPLPDKNELLVKVFATTINRTDGAILTGKPFIMRLLLGFFKPAQPVLGTDFAGVVAATGGGVTEYKAGDRVWGFDDAGMASQAEYMVVSTKKPILKIPGSLSFDEAAASAEGAHYAYNFINKVNIQPGQKVLINGAGGAIGSSALQLLKSHQAVATAVCSPASMDWVKSQGAAKVVDYTREDFTKDDEQYDYIFDTVGKSTFYECKKLLAPKGVYISSEAGPYAQNIFLSLLAPVTGGKKVKFPLPLDKKKSLQLIAGLVKQEKFRPLIDRKYAIGEVKEAYDYVLSGQKNGNVILVINDEHSGGGIR